MRALVRYVGVQHVVKPQAAPWLVLVVSLGLAWPASQLFAQQQEGTPVQLPSGSTLRVTLDGKTADVKIEDLPKPVAYRFGRKEQGRFVAYSKDQLLPYDKLFMVRVRFSSEPRHDQTTVLLKWENGGHMEIPVYKSKSDPKIFESMEHLFEDPSACQGLRFCVEGAGENQWTRER